MELNVTVLMGCNHVHVARLSNNPASPFTSNQEKIAVRSRHESHVPRVPRVPHVPHVPRALMFLSLTWSG